MAPDMLAYGLLTFPLSLWVGMWLGSAIGELLFGHWRERMVLAAPHCTLWSWDDYRKCYCLRLLGSPQRWAIRMRLWRLAWAMGAIGIVTCGEYTHVVTQGERR